MNVKCKYSAKYFPLVKKMQSQSPENFRKFLDENFEEADQIYNMFLGESFYEDSPKPIMEIQQIDKINGLKLNVDSSDSSLAFYAGRPSKHGNMLRNFKSMMIESSIYDRENKVFINSKNLNRNIFNNKIQLLNILADFARRPDLKMSANMFDYEVSTLTELANLILSNFESFINKSDIDQSPGYQEAFDSYVILNKFDKLLEENTPFITVKPELRRTDEFYVDKYIYEGPNVDHYTGFTTNEYTPADDYISELAKILLDYFPEINESNEEIDNTSITLSGFNNVMTKLILFIRNDPRMKKKYLSELQKGVNADINTLLTEYLKVLKSTGINDENHRTYLHNKIRSIQKFLYNKEMPTEIQNMFTQMAFKTVPSSYVTYEWDNVLKIISGRDLKERPILYQQYTISNIIQGSVYYFTNNKDNFNNLLSKYNINFDNNTISISKSDGGNVYNYAITYSSNKSGTGYSYETSGSFPIELFNNLLSDVLSYPIPDDLEQIARQVYPQTSANWNIQNLFAPLLATTLLASNNDPLFRIKDDLIDITPYISDIRKLAEILSVIHGSDVVNVIKNAEGNNLPLYQIISLVHEHNEIIQLINEQRQNNRTRENVSYTNLLIKNDGFLLSPKIRSDVSINGKIKKSSNLSVSEYLRLSIVEDFYQNLVKPLKSGETRTISIQPTTYADKSKHYLIQFNIEQTLHNKVNIKHQLDNYFDGKANSLEPIYDTLYESRNSEINALVKNILLDYNQAFNKEFATLEEINDYISKNNLDQFSKNGKKGIQDYFIDAGLIFYNEIHGAKIGGKFQMNDTIRNYHRIYNNKNLTKERLDKEKRKFLKDLIENEFTLNLFDPTVNSLFNKFTQWNDFQSGEVIIAKIKDNNGKSIEIEDIQNLNDIITNNWNIELHPVLEGFYITDTLLSNVYNNLMVGGVYAHANKNKEGVVDSTEWYEYGEASRLIAQYKRMVIYGATRHTYAQGLKNGVPPTVKIAVIQDEQGTVFNNLGLEKTDLDTMDGSGFISPYYSRLENNSLIDAKVGEDKKTIFHSLNSTYSLPTLLKWAAYTTTNSRRMFNRKADISWERLFRKMHSSINLDTNIDLSKYYENFFKNSDGKLIAFKDWRTDKYYYIDRVRSSYDNGKLLATRYLYESNKKGVIIGDEIIESKEIKNLYDLDEFFGGAYTMLYDDTQEELIFSESNTDLITNIIIEEDLRDKMIGYLVNTSAIKVGAGNVNQSNSFFDDNNLNTIEISTKFGGVQMNADHDLDMSEVTEMTQMISALEQMGFSHDLVTKIYQDIGQVIKESIKDTALVIDTNDKDGTYEILAKALIKSFMSDDKSTLGLAQSFVTLANKGLQESNLEYKIPFSANTINGAFIATTTSNLVKSGIRRKYAGIAAYLTPSNSLMQVYNFDNTNYTFNEILPIILDKGIVNDIDDNNQITRSAIDKAIDDIFIEEVDNPIIVHPNSLKIGDKIRIKTTEGEFYNIDILSEEILSQVVNNSSNIEIYKNLNPFIIPISKDAIDFEDTIVIKNLETGEIETVKIDSFVKYDKIKREFNPNLQYFNWTSKPKNLKGSNTFFDVITSVVNGIGITKTFSIYDTDSVRASLYVNRNGSKLSKFEMDVLKSALPEYDFSKKFNKTEILNLLKKETQNTLNALSENRFIKSSVAFGLNVRTVKPKNIKVTPTQIVMGKLHAAKLGLKPGDTIAKINSEGSNFFKKRMSGLYSIKNLNKDTYDVVLFDGNGKEFYIKVGDTKNIYKQFSGLNINENSDFKVIKGRVYYNGMDITSTEDKQFLKYTDENGNNHDLIIINNLERLNELNKSSLFDSYKFNYTNSNMDYLIPYRFRKNFETNTPINLETSYSKSTRFDLNNIKNITKEHLNSNEEIRFKHRLSKIADNKYEAFKKQLLYIGARIPTQSMQSFAPMEIVAFIDSDINDVYVSKNITFLQGSDYDIDKQYIMGYSLNDNGSFANISPLGRDYNADEVLNLPIPNGIKYTESENGYLVTLQDMEAFKLGRLSIFNSIMNSNLSEVSFDNNINKQDTIRFMRDLNIHSTSDINSFQTEEGLKNRVVDGILKVTLDPKNQINLHNPINMDEQHSAADKSILGKSEKTYTSDNPASKANGQKQNMEGKGVIGIVAVAMKSYFMLSNFYNEKYSKIINLLEANQYDEIMHLLGGLIFTNALDPTKAGVLANINFDSILRYLRERDITYIPISEIPSMYINLNFFNKDIINGNNLNIRSIIETLNNIADVPDASLVLSGLLSAATDNAKELILSKINATSNYADIYNYLVTIGISFDNVAKIMTSEIFNYVVKWTNSDIFNTTTYGFSLDNSASFYLNKSLLPIVHMDVWEKAFLDFNKSISESLDYTLDNNLMKEFRNSLRNRLKYERPTISEDFDDSMLYENFDDDFSEEWGSISSPIKRDFANNPLNYNDYRGLYTLVNYIIKRNNNLNKISNKKELENLELIYTNVLPAVKEMQIMGRMNSINQGIKTNNYDKYSYIKNIENFINRAISNYTKETGEELHTFDLMKFLKDPQWKELYISEYELIKVSHNILEAITTVPHFSEMFNMLYYDNELITRSSIKNKMELKFANEVLENITLKLNNAEFRELSRYTNDVLIYNWISGLNLELQIPKGQKYYINKLGNLENSPSDNFKINLNTTEGIASFKYLMDNHIIPSLKQDSILGTNKFINSLVRGISKSRYGTSTYWMINANMMQVDTSIKNETEYEDILNSFMGLSNEFRNGWKLHDLFYLYNLVVNKDGFGQRSFTRLFEDLVDPLSNNLVSKYYKYLYELDAGDLNIDLVYDINDLKFRLTSVSTNPYPRFKSYATDETVFIETENGTISKNPSDTNISYFTLNMPFLTQIANTPVQEVVKPIKQEVPVHFKTALDAKGIMIDIINNFNKKYNGNIHIIEDPNTIKAYIQSGEVYINLNYADSSSPIHEYTHIIMAGLKEIHPEVYYSLLSKIKNHELYDIILSDSRYDNVHGSDLDEEVFTTVVGEYFKNKLYKWEENNRLQNSDQYTKNVLQNLFEIDNADFNLLDFINSPLDVVLYKFGSALVSNKFDDYVDIEFVKLNQKMATIKDKLIQDGIIEEDCAPF